MKIEKSRKHLQQRFASQGSFRKKLEGISERSGLNDKSTSNLS